MTHYHVIKIGGSVLGTPDSIRGLAAWLASEARPQEKQLLIAGGGASVEGLRQIDRANPLPNESAHWAAIRLMDTHTRLLPAWLAGVSLAESPDDATGNGSSQQAVLVENWLREQEPNLPGDRLVAGWQTTSDAIAGRLASSLRARLTLLKHGDAEVYDDLRSASTNGLVDPETPRVASGAAEVRLVAFSGSLFSDFPAHLLDGPCRSESTA